MSAMQVEIIGNGDRGCEAGCGADWSSPSVQAEARAALRQRFGDGVTLKYSPGIARPGEVLPLVTVDGQVRLRGQFELRQLLDIVEVENEMRTASHE